MRSRDAVCLGLLRGSKTQRTPLQFQLASIRSMDTGHDVDERRFSRAVLTHERVDPSRLEGQVDIG
jgi:hypothetical protein